MYTEIVCTVTDMRGAPITFMDTLHALYMRILQAKSATDTAFSTLVPGTTGNWIHCLPMNTPLRITVLAFF